MFTTLKQWFLAFITLVIVTLSGALLYQKKRADKKDEEIDDLESEIKNNEQTHQVDKFESINKEKKSRADEEIHKDDTPSVKSNTTYSL